MADATAKRDAEVLAARADLARAETEAQRRDAILREVRAKLAWQASVDQEHITDHTEFVARVYAGEFTAGDALAITLGDDRLVGEELSRLAPPELWAEDNAYGANEQVGIERLERALETRDDDLALRFAQHCVTSSEGIARACLALRLASQPTSCLAARARRSIDEATSALPLEARITIIAQCALALDGAELDRAAQTARTMLADAGEVDASSTLAVIAALAIAGDESSARSLWRDRAIVNRLGYWNINQAILAHRALIAGLSAEARSSWESEVAESIDPNLVANVAIKLALEMTGLAREKLSAVLLSRDPQLLDESYVPLLDPRQRVELVRRFIDERLNSSDAGRCSLDRLDVFDDAIVELLVDSYRAHRVRFSSVTASLRAAIVRAARRGFAKAIACVREIPVDLVLSEPCFYDGLPVELVREILAKRPASEAASGVSNWIYGIDKAIDERDRPRLDAILATANIRFASLEPVHFDRPSVGDPRNSAWIEEWPQQATREFLSRDSAGRALGARRAEVAMRLWRNDDFDPWPAYQALIECIEFASEETLFQCEAVVWSDETSALAHRAIVRERELRAQRGIAANDLGPIARRAFAQLGDDDEPPYRWYALVRSLLGDPQFVGLRQRFAQDEGYWIERGLVEDCIELGIVSEVVEASDAFDARYRAYLLSALWSAMTAEDRARTLPWIEDRVREFGWTDVSPALMSDLPVRLLIEKWDKMSGYSIDALCMSAHAIKRIAGVEALLEIARHMVENHARLERGPLALFSGRASGRSWGRCSL